MKILQIINNLGSGGAEKLLSEIAPLMEEKGHIVEILLLKKENSIYIEELESFGIKVSYLHLNKTYTLKNLIEMKKYINNGNFDIINVHLFPGLYFISFLSLLKLINNKIIYTRHYNKSSRTSNFIFRKIDKFVYSAYDKIIAITDNVKENIINEKNISKEKIIVIENGVDITKFNKPITNQDLLYPSFNKSDIVLVMIGRFTHTKDQKTVIKSLEFLDNNVNLVLVGEGILIEENKQLAKKLNLSNRVHFLGLRKDIPQILHQSDIGILSSKLEGMPISALEIFASNIPFLGSNVKGINDLFKDIENKEDFLFEYENEKELSLKINTLIKNEKQQLLNKNVCKKIVEQYSLSNMVDRYLQTYKNLQEGN